MHVSCYTWYNTAYYTMYNTYVKDSYSDCWNLMESISGSLDAAVGMSGCMPHWKPVSCFIKDSETVDKAATL